MDNQTTGGRASGIVLHLTSLPGRWGIGDLGAGAHAFVDWLAAAGQSYWQMLPVGPTGYGNSPYALLSLFGGNPLLIAPDVLAKNGLLAAPSPPGATDASRVDYGHVLATKLVVLRDAAARFLGTASGSARARFAEFCAVNVTWLDDCCRFLALKDQNGGRAWPSWTVHEPDPARVALHRVLQFWFHRQWADLRDYANARGIQLIGDVPIYPAYDSADVWAHPGNYQLDAQRRPVAVAGVPPDYFSPTGQLWGNPVYDWEVLRRDGFSWWVARMRYLGGLFDVLRLDHFRGFAAYWRVPAGQPTAEHGEWVPAPGRELFATLVAAGTVRMPSSRTGVQCIAEDLGLITDDVIALREEFRFPGMRVAQFGFGNDPANPHFPHNYRPDVVAYTGTHDNDTTAGWYEASNEATRAVVQWYLGADPTQWTFVRYVAGSCARLVLFPLQDVLGLGSEARMNVPGQGDGNWSWRVARSQFTDDVSVHLREITERYARLPRRV